MSTKIFHAFRIPKDRDILKELRKSKDIATNIIANDYDYLKMIHTIIIGKVLKKLEKDPDNPYYKSIIEDNKKGDFDIISVIHILERNVYSPNRLDISTKLECVIYYDDDYWYIKFFPNENIQYKIIDKIQKELGFEDYHYQNQTDKPDGITIEEYNKRIEKWDELLKSSNDDYNDGLIYDIFGPNQFKKLLFKNYYTGKPLYDHLSYKFDRIYVK